jgi:hypothetical protein
MCPVRLSAIVVAGTASGGLLVFVRGLHQVVKRGKRRPLERTEGGKSDDETNKEQPY